MTAQFCVDVKEAKLAQSLFLAWLDMTQENTFAISDRKRLFCSSVSTLLSMIGGKLDYN